MLNLSHGQSPLWCGSQNHHRDPSPGYGPLLRHLGAAQVAITFNGASFPTCYGIQSTNHERHIYAFQHIFDRVCREHHIEHRLTKINHP